jgi:hypothetical protein
MPWAVAKAKLPVADASLAPNAALFAPKMKEVFHTLLQEAKTSCRLYCAAVLVIIVKWQEPQGMRA